MSGKSGNRFSGSDTRLPESKVTPTIGAAWRAVRDRFRAAGIETASLDARLLAEAAFGIDATRLAISENDPAASGARETLDGFAARRLAREPVARILGEKAFYGLDFALSDETLVPRPETELLVDLALDALADIAAPRILDLGTGTGCIVIAILANLTAAMGVATDLSPDALDTARVNAARHGAIGRLDFRHGDWFAALGSGERFDLIVSNPPYIASADIAGLDIEVKRHDPLAALDGGDDGLAPYRVLAAESARHLAPGGRLLVEHGTGQSAVISGLFERHGFVEIASHDDLAGHDRALQATWPGEKRR